MIQRQEFRVTTLIVNPEGDELVSKEGGGDEAAAAFKQRNRASFWFVAETKSNTTQSSCLRWARGGRGKEELMNSKKRRGRRDQRSGKGQAYEEQRGNAMRGTEKRAATVCTFCVSPVPLRLRLVHGLWGFCWGRQRYSMSFSGHDLKPRLPHFHYPISSLAFLAISLSLLDSHSISKSRTLFGCLPSRGGSETQRGELGLRGVGGDGGGAHTVLLLQAGTRDDC